jgi:hypothetical protein
VIKHLTRVSPKIYQLYVSFFILGIITFTTPQKLRTNEIKHRTTTSRNMGWVRQAAPAGETRNAYKIFVENPEGKIPRTRQACMEE